MVFVCFLKGQRLPVQQDGEAPGVGAGRDRGGRRREARAGGWGSRKRKLFLVLQGGIGTTIIKASF